MHCRSSRNPDPFFRSCHCSKSTLLTLRCLRDRAERYAGEQLQVARHLGVGSLTRPLSWMRREPLQSPGTQEACIKPVACTGSNGTGKAENKKNACRHFGASLANAPAALSAADVATLTAAEVSKPSTAELKVAGSAFTVLDEKPGCLPRQLILWPDEEVDGVSGLRSRTRSKHHLMGTCSAWDQGEGGGHGPYRLLVSRCLSQWSCDRFSV